MDLFHTLENEIDIHYARSTFLIRTTTLKFHLNGNTDNTNGLLQCAFSVNKSPFFLVLVKNDAIVPEKYHLA